ncbi:MAG: MATE family efflux transporter [Myxococcaceae bacterium]|nr:MATE family efflux transporter [Myxococcaceae bacterium]
MSSGPHPALTAAPALRTGLRPLLRLAWPIVISRSTQVIIGLGDALMVAHLGESGLAATSAGAFNTYVFLILPMGVVFIVSSFASQLFGAGDHAGARRYGFYGLGVALLTQVLCLALLPAVPALLGLLEYDAEVHRLMSRYIVLRLLSGGAAIGIEALGNYYGGLGNTRLPMAANVLAMALDLVGNYALIGGHLGAPAMGVDGAALSSTLSTFLVFALFAGVFLAEGRRLGRVVPRLHVREFVRMLRFGLPSGFNWFFEFFAFNFFVNVVLGGLGTTALAAFMAVLQLNSVAFQPAFALASAGAILVGQSIGGGRKDEVPHLVRLTFGASAFWQVLVGLAYVLVPGLLLEPFTTGGPGARAFVEVGTRMLLLTTAWQLLDAAATTLAEALRAAGDTAFTLWARVFIAWALFVPGSYVSVRHLGWGDVGAVSWVVLYLGLLAAALFVRFRNGRWRDIELVEQPVV